MPPAVRDRLKKAAYRFLAAKPWTIVGDDYLFGLADRVGGLSGCVTILGGAGQEFGLNVALGEEGFAILEKLVTGEVDASMLKVKQNSVLFSISNAVPASRMHAQLAPYFLDQRKVKDPTRGYLTGIRFVASRGPRVLEEAEATFLARCLEAVAELAETGRLGQDALLEGPRRLSFDLLEVDGRLTITRSYREVTEVAVEHDVVELTAEQVERIKARPRVQERYLLSIFSPPGSIQGAAYWAALLMDDRQQILMVDMATDFNAAAQLVFEALAGRNKTGERDIPLPTLVCTDSRPVLDALSPALNRVGVLLVAAEVVPELEIARESLADFMAGGAGRLRS